MEKIRIQDDLYQYVNGEAIEKMVIPADRPMVGGFADLDRDVEKQLMADFEAFSKGELSTDIKEMAEAIKLYQKVIDVERRNSEGIIPAMPYLNLIKSIDSIDKLNELSYELMLKQIELPFNFGVTEDMADATRHAFIVLGQSLILPDTTYYGTDKGNMMLNMYLDATKQMLEYTNLTQEEKELFLNDTVEFDSMLAKSVKSQLEWADYVKNHNPFKVEDVAEMLKPFDLINLLKQIYPKLPEEIIVYDPRAIKEFKNYFNETNFMKYVHWTYIKFLNYACGYLSTDLKTLSTAYRRGLMGVKEDPVIEKQAYQMVSRVFSEVVGIYYGRKYFGEEAKADVIRMVKEIIETYKLRMKKNPFLAEETKAKAINKLSTIEIKMGYPDKVRELFSKYIVNEEKSYFENIEELKQITLLDELNKLFKEVDRSVWAMPGNMVNACYNPSANDITFPAAILQKPFYSINQTYSENLGGIGAVIGHEISHAFDNNGAHFDEKGNLNNWWKEEDFAKFEELTKGMIEQFDGIEIHGGKVNGQLVVSENIADNGGMGVTLEIMKNYKDADYQKYFINWAKVWCRKAKEELMQLLLTQDVHSPAELRANITPRNFSEWYEAFDVKDTDKMYIPKEKRISIW